MAMEQVRFGVANDKGAPNVRFGIDKGFFADAGMDVTIHRVYGGPELAGEIESGKVDLAEFGAPPALNAIGAGARYKIVASGMRQKFLMYLGVKREIADWSGLKGATVGLLSRGSCDEWLAREMWAKNGLDPDRDLGFYAIKADYPRLYDLMEDGAFDAVLAAEPTMALGEHRGQVRVWQGGFEPDYVPDYQWGVMVAPPATIDARPDMLSKFIAIAAKSAAYVTEHPDEWADFMGRQQRIGAAVAARAIGRELPLYRRDCRLHFKGLEQAAALQMRVGGIDHPLKIDAIVDPRFMPDQIAA